MIWKESLTKIVPAVSLISAIVAVTSFLVGAYLGDVSSVIGLRVIAIISILVAIISWSVWVTITITKIQKTKETRISSITQLVKVLDHYEINEVYFDGSNRNFFSDLEFRPGTDVIHSEYEDKKLAETWPVENAVRIQRIVNKYRWILSIIKYKNTTFANTDTYIPADTDPAMAGNVIKFIYYSFRARVGNDPYRLIARLRKPGGAWLQSYPSRGANIFREMNVTNSEWEEFDGLLGPIQVDQDCYFSIDIMPGPAGEGQDLYISELKILDMREKQAQTENQYTK